MSANNASYFLAYAIPNLLRQHVSSNAKAHQRRIAQWKAGNWFGLQTERLVELFEPYFNPNALSQLLSSYLGRNVHMIVLEYATCDNEQQPHIGVIFQDEKLALWDKMLGKPLSWLLTLLVKEVNLGLTVETIKSPADLTITTFGQGRGEPELKRSQPQTPTSRWTLVVLHNKGEKYYEKLLRSYRSRVLLELPGKDKPFVLLEPASHMAANKQKKTNEGRVQVKEVVQLKDRVLCNIALCFGSHEHAAANDDGFCDEMICDKSMLNCAR